MTGLLKGDPRPSASSGNQAISAVLFDLGGVVCRFRSERRLAALAADCGLPVSEVRARVWDSGFDAECDAGRYTAGEIYWETKRLLDLNMSYEQFRSAWALAFEPNRAVIALAATLAGRVRTPLLTNNGPVLLDAMPIIFPEIAGRFRPLLFSCELGALKPNSKLFAEALLRLNEPAEHVLLVDDSPEAVDGAQKAGLATIRFTTAESLQSELAQLISPRA